MGALRKWAPLFHIVGWMLFFSLFAVFLTHSPSEKGLSERIFSFPFFVFVCVYMFLFYANAKYLVPKLYFKNKQPIYFLIILLMLICVFFIEPFDHLVRMDHAPGAFDAAHEMHPHHEHDDGHHHGPRVDITSLIVFAMIWSLSFILCLVKQWRLAIQRTATAEADKANAELSFLKAQINPHFLFNTLNNIYALTVSKSDTAPDAVMKLSNIMRYVTDEATESFVPLEDEISCIKDYIDLQKLRLNTRTQINFSVQGLVTDQKIAPLILITYIENCFKYGVSNHEDSPIMIKIIIEENKIKLFCRNKIFSHKSSQERSGKGIANNKKRLEYLYPGKHLLFISEENDVFEVQLILTEYSR